MAEGKRPGGLTALAVLNFVFGGFAAIGSLLFLTASVLISKGTSMVEEAGGHVTSHGPGMAILWISFLLYLVSAILLITSGVGYIKQRRFLGRTLGTGYALVSIGHAVVDLALVGGGFGIGTIIGLVYPVLTLILVNTTFKDDLTN
jgi:hypothetical protein